jgi:hypothetical protein
MNDQHVLTKTLRDGGRLDISIAPFGSPDSSAWELVLTRDGREWIRTRNHPREVAAPPAPGITHALPIDDGRDGGKAVGLTAAEADKITAAFKAHYERQAQRQKDRIKAEMAEAEARARAAAPDAPVFTLSGPDGAAPPGPGETARLGDGRAVTGLRTWKKYYGEDGWTFGVMDESGYLYFSECREATPEERAGLEGREARQARREGLMERAAELSRTADGEIPAEVTGDLHALPSARIRPARRTEAGAPYIQLRTDEGAGALWLLIYNGADGDNWSYSNYGAYIARRIPLTPELAALAADLRAEFGSVD